MPPFSLCSHSQRLVRLTACTAILALAFAWTAGPARADGDPASDVLASQALFLPQDATIPATQQAQLAALLQTAQRAGYQLRVALIASPSDLGSVTALWRRPESYARFLGQELELVYRGPLLVVMPNGYGQYPVRGRLGAQSGRADLGAPSAQLGTSALSAIQRLAAASGYTLTLPSATPPAAAVATDTLSWVVFAVGGVLILLAWAASFRAKPLQMPRRNVRAP